MFAYNTPLKVVYIFDYVHTFLSTPYPQLQSNSFDIEDETDENSSAIAAAIVMMHAPILSLNHKTILRSSVFNHFCELNCVRLIDGREIVVKTMLNIPASEQVSCI